MGFLPTVFFTFFCLLLGIVNSEARELRALDRWPVVILPNIVPTGADEDSAVLAYEDQTALRYFFTLPDSFSDRTYNVRFSPTFHPFYLKAMLIPLFNLFGAAGHPNMQVSVWQSGEVDGEPGMPAEFIDTLNVDGEHFIFSGRDTIRYNYIDLTSLQFSSTDSLDFHIGVDIHNSREHDTLAIYLDNAHDMPSDRSIFWNGVENNWVKVIDNTGHGYNFAIRAVITDTQPWGIPADRNGNRLPTEAALLPAFPNPFNSAVTISFTVPNTEQYRLSIYDLTGRLIGDLRHGKGIGAAAVTVNATNLPAGVYNVMLQTKDVMAAQRIVLLK